MRQEDLQRVLAVVAAVVAAIALVALAVTLPNAMRHLGAEALSPPGAATADRIGSSVPEAAKAALAEVVPPAVGQWVVERSWRRLQGDERERWRLRWISAVAEGAPTILEQELAAADAALAAADPAPFDARVSATPSHQVLIDAPGVEVVEVEVGGRRVRCGLLPARPASGLAAEAAGVASAQVQTWLYTPELGVHHALTALTRLEVRGPDGALIHVREVISAGTSGGAARPVRQPAGPAGPEISGGEQ